MPSPDQSSLPDPPPPGPPEQAGENRILRIATRESPLALWQARHVAELLSQFSRPPQIVPMLSSGDVDMRPIDGKRSVGVFTKRIQQGLLDDEGDVAVHSMKDLPTERHPALTVVASPRRETVADCLVSPEARNLDELPPEARVGTGSRRRAAQLLRVRPDLQILPIRGNVQTRLQKMADGQYDAIVLAAAGIERLEMHDLPRVELSAEVMLPAPGQGALAIEVRRDDLDAIATVARLDRADTTACTVAERTLLARLHGGCLAPIAALATVSAPTDEEPRCRLRLVARVLSADGTECLEFDADSPIELESVHWRQTAEEIGDRVANELIARGAKDLIESSR